MKKLSESVYVGCSVLELSKMIMHEFWYYYVTPKYGEKSKIVLHGCFIVYTKRQVIFIKTFQKMLKLDLLLRIMN